MTRTPSSRKPIPIKHRRRQARTPNVASNPFSCSPLRGKGTRVFQYNLPDVLFGELAGGGVRQFVRSEEHTSELQSLMRISYAVFCLKKQKYPLSRPLIM